MASSSNVTLGIPGVAQSNDYFYLIPDGFNASNNIQITISGVAGPAMTTGTGTCAIPSQPWQDSFNFTWDNSGSEPAVVVTIAAATATVTSDNDRATLRADFDKFLAQLRLLEATDENNLACLIPGAAAIIANRVALSIPLRVSETLGYYYNFDQEKRWIDLIPGMRIQVQPAPYSYIALTGTSYGKDNSFVTSGQYEIDVTIGPDANIAFSGWTGAIKPPKVKHLYAQNDGANNDAGTLSSELDSNNDITYEIQVLGLADFAAADMLKRHWRLAWPPNLSGATTPKGAAIIRENVALIGCNDPASLETASQSFISATTQELWKPGPPVGDKMPVYAFFTGRATIVPQFSIVLNGVQTWVPAGTTIRQLSAQFGLPSLKQMVTTQQSGGGFNTKLLRWGAQPFALNEVTFADSHQAFFDQAGLSMWDLPVMCGDQITF